VAEPSSMEVSVDQMLDLVGRLLPR